MSNAIKLTLVLLLLMVGSFVFAISAVHNPVNIMEDTDTRLDINILETDSDISNITLYYRANGQSQYSSIELLSNTSSLSSFSFSIQFAINELKAINAEFIEYYLSISNTNQITAFLPAMNPEFNPYQTRILNMNYSDSFVIIAPESLDNIPEGESIVISYFAIKDELDPNSIKISMNNRTIKSDVTVEDGIVLIKMPQTTNKGQLAITAKLRNGEKISSPVWSLSGINKVRNLAYNGNLTFISNTNSYSSDSDDSNLESFDEQALLFNFSAFYKKLIVRNNIYISSLEDKEKQRINNYYLGFISPYFDAHFGDYSPNYSEFTVSNKKIFGFTAKAKSPYTSLSFSLGEINRAIEAKEDVQASFKRKHMSTKLTFGNSNSFALSINVAKNKDVVNSLDETDYIQNPTDETPIYSIEAKDNVVFGSDLEWNLFSRKVYLFAEYAMSIYNSNIIPGVISKDSLENFLDADIPFDPESFESIIIINKNLEPYNIGMNNSALKAGIRLNFLRNTLSFSFLQTGPSFYSLSSSGINQDKRYIRISDNYIHSSNLFFSGGLELSNDNVVDQKQQTLSNLNFYLNANYSPNNLPFFGLSFITNRSGNDSDNDLMKIDNQSNYFQISSGYSYQYFSFAYTTSNLTFGFGSDKDNTSKKLFDNSKNDIGMNTIFRFNEFPLISKVGLSFSTNKDKAGETLSTNFTSLYLNNEYSFYENKVIPYFNLKANFNGGDNNETSSTIFNFGTKYYPIKNTWITADLNYKIFNDERNNSDNSYNMFATKLILSTSF